MSAIHAAGRASTIVMLVVFGVMSWLAAALAIPMLSQGATPRGRVLPITDPTTQARLAWEDLEYIGAFRLPATESAGDNFSSGGGPLTYYPEHDSLFVGARSGKVAEVSIPEPVRATDIAELPASEYLQPFADPTEGHIKDVASEGAALAGLLVYQDRLYGSGLIYYDANNTQSVSHFSRPLSLSAKGAGPMRRVGAAGKVGMVAGYMAVVPPEWRSKLGGPALTGQCCVPIVSRTSWGPAAFVWDPAQLEQGKNADADALVYYTSEHPTLGPWDGSNPTYGGTIQMGGLAVLAGTRTAIFVGRNGTGPFCYGNGTGDQGKVNSVGSDGERYCFDPANSDKGQHAYPYRYQIWAYDLNDWAAVHAGKQDPWSVKPYGVWPFELPFPEPSTRIGGIAFDPERRRLYVSQLQADRDGYAYRALIHTFHIK